MLKALERIGDLDEALGFNPDSEGGLVAAIPEGLSNAPQSMDASRGAPFGGLMAALSV